jgi:hypothetical protein
MRIGFDFDNTIVCYDQAIKILSVKIDLPENLDRDKLSIRDYLRSQNRENEWTEFQGTLYGPGMIHAKTYDFFFEVANKLTRQNHELFIVSHRSKYPYAGEKYDLHQYAWDWLEEKNKSPKIINNKNIYFLETLSNKIEKIKYLEIDLFIDDLLEVINHDEFPKKIKSILFDPNKNNTNIRDRIEKWNQLFIYV